MQGNFVKVKDNNFYLNGKIWHPFGVNYWPRYVTLRRTCGSVFWLDPVIYEAEIVEQDLSLIEEIGMNMVGIVLVANHYEPDLWWQENHLRYKDSRDVISKEKMDNLYDFLEKAKRHNLKVACFIVGANPLYFNEWMVKQWLEKDKLTDNDTIFAWDIAWEPHLAQSKDPSWRRIWDAQWEKWVINRYGSLGKAEKDWGYSLGKGGDYLASPGKEHLLKRGPWDRLVSAYARFVNDFVSKKFAQATRKIREIDPNHLIGAHTVGLCGQIGQEAEEEDRPDTIYYHDAPSVAKHLDYLGVEWLVHGFSVLYSRFWGREKPVIFGEFGYNTADPNPKESLKKQKEKYRDWYQMMIAAGAKGAIAWWFPGGGRMEESWSDYGIVNPDGTPRPACEVIKELSSLFAKPRELKEPEVWIELNKERYTPGFFEECNQAAKKYEEIVSQGKVPGLRTEATGTDSSNVPLTTICDVPYNRENVLRHLNAEFNYLRIKDINGSWVEIKDGDSIKVKSGKTLYIDVSLGNIQEAEWLAPEKEKQKQKGRVYLVIRRSDQKDYRKGIPSSTPYLEDANFPPFSIEESGEEKEITFQMEVFGRGTFGEKIKVRVKSVKLDFTEQRAKNKAERRR